MDKINQYLEVALDFIKKAFEFLKSSWRYITDNKWLFIGALIVLIFLISIPRRRKRRKELEEFALARGYKDVSEFRKEYWKYAFGLRKEKQLEIEKARELTPLQKEVLHAEDMVWEENNPDHLTGLYKENYKDLVKTQIERFKHLGVKKDIHFEPDPKANEFYGLLEYEDDGKIKRALQSVFGEMLFAYYDSSGKKLYNNTLPFSEVQFSLASGISDSEGKKNCINCGSEIEYDNQDSYSCPYCKSKVYKEDYKNLVNQLNIFSYNIEEKIKFNLLNFVRSHPGLVAFFTGLLFVAYYVLALTFPIIQEEVLSIEPIQIR